MGNEQSQKTCMIQSSLSEIMQILSFKNKIPQTRTYDR